MGIPFYGQRIEVRLQNLIDSTSYVDKNNTLEVLQRQFVLVASKKKLLNDSAMTCYSTCIYVQFTVLL